MTGEPRHERRPLVLAGLPRSGTTWTMRVLATDPSLVALMEPDNEVRSAPAIWAKRHTGRYPVLQPGDRDDAITALWSWVMDGAPEGRRLEATRLLLRAVRPAEHRRYYRGGWAPLMRLAGLVGSHPGHRSTPDPSGRRIFVKTVYMPLALEWLAATFDPDVLVLLRHPGNVLASWISLDLNDRYV
ncbi:MAG: sulfotransferase, partial [Acidimicrobiales bacterium]